MRSGTHENKEVAASNTLTGTFFPGQGRAEGTGQLQLYHMNIYLRGLGPRYNSCCDFARCSGAAVNSSWWSAARRIDSHDGKFGDLLEGLLSFQREYCFFSVFSCLLWAFGVLRVFYIVFKAFRLFYFLVFLGFQGQVFGALKISQVYFVCGFSV